MYSAEELSAAREMEATARKLLKHQRMADAARADLDVALAIQMHRPWERIVELDTIRCRAWNNAMSRARQEGVR